MSPAHTGDVPPAPPGALYGLKVDAGRAAPFGVSPVKRPFRPHPTGRPLIGPWAADPARPIPARTDGWEPLLRAPEPYRATRLGCSQPRAQSGRVTVYRR